MYRVAVIQNGIEMQHSGYVDALPMYKRFACIGKEKAEFTRFSGVNIRELFFKGEKYLLDFDVLILGTNATSDDDVYSVLREDESKKLLGLFIESGKGLLVCSQKKYIQKEDTNSQSEYKVLLDTKKGDFIRNIEDTGRGELFYFLEEVRHKNNLRRRVSAFMPAHYEYVIDERPASESSRDGLAVLVADERCTLNQKCIMCLPHKITNETIKRHCEKNAFQQHYYRDIITPVYGVAYQPVVVDIQKGDIRNLLMVAVPQKKEKIVISTMALDWAGHEELLENILNYLTRGVPHIAFVHKNNFQNSEMKILTLDAEMSKVGNIEYSSIKDYLNNMQWHSLVVFSPDYTEDEVVVTWKDIKKNNKFTKVYHYCDVDDELVLVKYSNNEYIEQQKMDVLAWLNSKRGKRLWDNSLWKTYDVVKLLYHVGKEDSSTIGQVVETIIREDEKGKSHYRDDGSYDGVLAPSCGVLEILYWAKECFRNVTERVEKYENYYQKTREYLIGRYNMPTDNTRNKMFILRSLFRCNDVKLPELVDDFILTDIMSYGDMVDLDLCLYIEVEIALYMYSEYNKGANKREIVNAITELLNRQMTNGRWDSLSNTANILIVLLQNIKVLKEDILKEVVDRELVDKIYQQVDRGITVIKSTYLVKDFNWENNIVTTANALLALYLYNQGLGYKSNGILKNFVDEVYSSADYNALNMALNTLDEVIEDFIRQEEEIYSMQKKMTYLEKSNNRMHKRLYFVASFAGFGVFGLLSTFIWLALKSPIALRDIISEVFMWIPIVIGMAIPPIVMFVIKRVSTVSEKQIVYSGKTKRKGVIK